MRRKYLLILFGCIALFLLHACNKKASQQIKNTFVKTIIADSDVTLVNSLPMSDGGFILIGRDFVEMNSGQIAKLDADGKLLWQKKLSPLNRVLWKAIKLSNDGFATIGYLNGNSANLVICLYNNLGDLISTHDIPIPFTTGAQIGSATPFEIIQLKSGNFVLAGSDGMITFNGYMIITDNAFNILYSKTFLNPGGFSGYYIRGICEMPDSSIALTASGYYVASTTIQRTFTYLLRTKLNGTQKSFTIINDSLYSQTPNCLIESKVGMVGVTAKMKGWSDGNGLFVNYLNNNQAQLISGIIAFNRFDINGQFIDSKLITSYPKNGMINSMKATSDGGYILCGTVNQENTVTLVSYTTLFALKIDANLNTQWSKNYETTFPSFGVDVLETNDGGYLLSGYQKSLNKRYEMFVIKTDANGNTN